jgi:hypothetical protein
MIIAFFWMQSAQTQEVHKTPDNKQERTSLAYAR